MNNMNKYLFKIWTGPVAVKEMAQKFRDAGIEVKTEGTEHIYVVSSGSDSHAASWKILSDLNKKYNKDFGVRPQMVRRIVD